MDGREATDEQDVLMSLKPMDGREATDEQAQKAGKSRRFIRRAFGIETNVPHWR
jgi:hypothetical protein